MDKKNLNENESKISEQGYELELTEYGYVICNNGPVEVKKGRVKVADFIANGSFINDSILLPDIVEGKSVPTEALYIKYQDLDNGFESSEEICNNTMENYQEFADKIDKCTSSEEYKKCINEQFNGQFKYVVDDNKELYGHLYNSDYVMVYNTSFSPELNKKLLIAYIENDREPYNFIAYHFNDLMECLGGTDKLKEFTEEVDVDFEKIQSKSNLSKSGIRLRHQGNMSHHISEIADIVSDRKIENVNKTISDISAEVKEKSNENEYSDNGEQQVVE